MSTKSKAFAKMLSTKIGTYNKKNNKAGVKPAYDNAYLNGLIGVALDLPKMPENTNAREWCSKVKAPLVDVRLVVHENKKKKNNISCERPENTVRARLETLAKIDKKIERVAYCRYLINGTTDASDATNNDAYLVHIYKK